MTNAGFSKEEKLKSRKLIEALVKNGNRDREGGINMIWMMTDDDRSQPVQVVISVPKRKFKRAVDRNLLKRRIREAYRLNKKPLTDLLFENNIRLNIMFLFQEDRLLAYSEIEDKLVLLLKRLCSEHEKSS